MIGAAYRIFHQERGPHLGDDMGVASALVTANPNQRWPRDLPSQIPVSWKYAPLIPMNPIHVSGTTYQIDVHRKLMFHISMID